MNNPNGLEGFVYSYYPERHAGIVAQFQNEGKFVVAKTTVHHVAKVAEAGLEWYLIYEKIWLHKQQQGKIPDFYEKPIVLIAADCTNYIKELRNKDRLWVVQSKGPVDLGIDAGPRVVIANLIAFIKGRAPPVEIFRAVGYTGPAYW